MMASGQPGTLQEGKSHLIKEEQLGMRKTCALTDGESSKENLWFHLAPTLAMSLKQNSVIVRMKPKRHISKAQLQL